MIDAIIIVTWLIACMLVCFFVWVLKPGLSSDHEPVRYFSRIGLLLVAAMWLAATSNFAGVLL